jgi:hypothetical protein
MNNPEHFRSLSSACVHAAFSPPSTVTFEALTGMKTPVLSGFAVFFRIVLGQATVRWWPGSVRLVSASPA